MLYEVITARLRLCKGWWGGGHSSSLTLLQSRLPFLFFVGVLVEVLDASFDEHEGIVAAFADGDAELAERLIRGHVDLQGRAAVGLVAESNAAHR